MYEGGKVGGRENESLVPDGVECGLTDVGPEARLRGSRQTHYAVRVALTTGVCSFNPPCTAHWVGKGLTG